MPGRRFRGDAGLVLLQRGGPLVIRRLCAAMGPEVVFREFASILDGEEDLGFASTMVQVRCVKTNKQHQTTANQACLLVRSQPVLVSNQYVEYA